VIFRSPYPDVRVPDVPLHRFVLAGAAVLGDKPALIDGPSGRTLTYGQLGAGVARIAAGLAAQGFKPGDVLGVVAGTQMSSGSTNFMRLHVVNAESSSNTGV